MSDEGRKRVDGRSSNEEGRNFFSPSEASSVTVAAQQ